MNPFFRKVQVSFNLALLGSGVFYKVYIWLLAWTLPVIARFGYQLKKSRRIVISKFGREASFYVFDNMDLLTLYEIFVTDPYEIDVETPDIIIDIGSNIGCSALFFHLRYPHARIIAYEANPETMVRLIKNTESVHLIFAQQLAVGSENGSTIFYPNKVHISSSIKPRSGAARPIVVPLISLDSVIESAGGEVGLLKFDIEGGEESLFQGARKLVSIKRMIGEVHFDLMEMDREDFLALFPDHDVELTPISNSRFIADIKRRETYVDDIR